ncbi:hypothetical protein HHK36_030201 [Tetracentron sinense]|uniref:cyclin-dependent kinase n=1 Tax=Tetracentron sinense TaxID=13715 RepID=A0A835D0B2_TETSI|nr:hypothetical protein HHK36_030201 [Tetracentron sinense]
MEEVDNLDKYDILEEVGKGAYGVVYKARDVLTNDIVALKKVDLGQGGGGVPSSALREISILKEMDHENIVRLKDVVHNKKSLYLVLEYLDLDLKKYMDTCPELATDRRVIKVALMWWDNSVKLQEVIIFSLLQTFLYQILRGVTYCHSHRVLHRDLKPQNLLIDCRTNTLKIVDFGLARAFGIPLRQYTPEVATLGYRAPEILLGTHQYSTPVDVWSVGCIFAEMVKRRPLFCGDSEIEHLLNVFGCLGTPNEETWPGVTSLSDFRLSFPKWPPKELETLVPGLEQAGVDLLSALTPSDIISGSNAFGYCFRL